MASKAADDGMPFMNKPVREGFDVRLKIIDLEIQGISVYCDGMYKTCSGCRNCASNNNMYKKFCVFVM